MATPSQKPPKRKLTGTSPPNRKAKGGKNSEVDCLICEKPILEAPYLVIFLFRTWLGNHKIKKIKNVIILFRFIACMLTFQSRCSYFQQKILYKATIRLHKATPSDALVSGHNKIADGRMIRTSGLALQTLHAFCNEALHGLYLLPSTIHAESPAYQVSLFITKILFYSINANMYLYYLYECKKCHKFK